MTEVRRRLRVGVDRRRMVALLVVLSLFALAGVASTSVRHRREAAAIAPTGAVSYAYSTNRASSSAWYCAGPLPSGTDRAHSSIAVANITGAEVRGEVLFSSESGPVVSVSIRLEPHSQTVLAVPKTETPNQQAATVLVDGDGIGVQEVVHDQAGSTSSACVNHVVSREYFPAGTTLGAANISLSLFNPGATPSVASVSFATSTGPSLPADFQGVSIPPEGIVVLSVGHSVPSRASVSATVSSTGGHIVAGALVSQIVGGHLVGALTTGSPNPEPSWYFGGLPGSAASRQTFKILNPGRTTAQVTVALGGTKTNAVARLTIAPGATGDFSPAPVPSSSALFWADVSSSSRTPVVASREVLINSTISNAAVVASHVPRSCPNAKRGTSCPGTTVRSPIFAMPTRLSPGFALTAGSLSPTREWLLPGGESDRDEGELVSLANPGVIPSHLTVRSLAGKVLADLSDLVLAPGGVAMIDFGRLLPGRYASLPVTVTSSTPIVVDGVLYAKGRPTAVGFSAYVAIPIR